MENYVLSYLTRIANSLFPYRIVFYFSGLALAGITFYLLQDSSAAGQDLTLYLLGLIWLLLFNAMLHIFYQPNAVKPATGWFSRIKVRLLALLQKLIIGLFILISIAVVYLTFKLLKL